MTSIDVSGWAPAGPEPLGTKPKQWIVGDDGELWLWKESTFNTDASGHAYRKGDDWAEVVAARVAGALGIPAATVHLAHTGGTLGVVSRRVHGEDEHLVHGNELLAGVGVITSDDHDRTGYTPARIEEALIGVDVPSATHQPATAFGWFAAYLLLDALIGNTDRHQDNWGVVHGPSGRRLAPSFDHASCLGFLLSDAERSERLETRDANRSPEGYARRARSKLEGTPLLADAAIDALARLSLPGRRALRDMVEAAPPLGSLIMDIDSDRFGPLARAFAEAVYDSNHRFLSQALRTVVA